MEDMVFEHLNSSKLPLLSLAAIAKQAEKTRCELHVSESHVIDSACEFMVLSSL